MESTPLPWHWVQDRYHGGYFGLFGGDGTEVVVPQCENNSDTGAAWFEEISEADAELIVCAVNNHDNLLETLNKIWGIASENESVFGLWADVRHLCKTVISEATEKGD